MRVYRLARKKYAKDLSGTGAKLNGGRWNSKGNEALYTAEHISLAKLEVAVHLSLDLIPDDYCLITLELPKSCKVKTLSLSDLPIAWDAIPYQKGITSHAICQLHATKIRNATQRSSVFGRRPSS